MGEDHATETASADPVETKLAAVRELCRRFSVRRLDLFGSAATGRFDPDRSDLDFLVEFEPEPPMKAPLRLLEALESLFGRKVDLLTEQGLINPYLRRRIEMERRTLFPVAMISNQAAKLLWDARRAGEQIARFTAGKTYDDYVDDDMLRAAVERQFEISGQAFGNLRRLDAGLAAQLPELSQIIGFRNVLIHGYDTINHRTVWDVAQDDLPRLLAAVTQLLGSAPPG